MSGSFGAGWAGLAGAAQGLLSQMNNQRDFQQKIQLDTLQQQAQQAREEFLIGLRGTQTQANNQQKADIASTQFKNFKIDPETGNLLGISPDGSSTIVNQTSDNYQANLKAAQDAAVANKQAQTGLIGSRTTSLDLHNADAPDINAARINSQNASADFKNAQTQKLTDGPDPTAKIQQQYFTLTQQFNQADARAAAAAAKAGTPYNPATPEQADLSVRAKMYSVYGGNAVNSALGGNQGPPVDPNAPTPDPNQAAPPSGAPSLPAGAAPPANVSPPAGAAPPQPVGGTGDPNDPLNSPQAQAIMKQATAEQWPAAKVQAALVQATGVKAQPPKTVVRTGVDAHGNRVAQFSDGSIGPAP